MDSKKLEMESKIIDIIYKDNRNTVHFEYENENDKSVIPKVTLNLITYNKIHGQYFLLHKTSGDSTETALSKMYQYILEHKERKINGYTVSWSRINGDHTKTSIFTATHIGEVMDKFYYGKNIEDYIVFEVRLNPIA